MDWLDNIKKELEVSKNHPIRKKRDWEIERDIRLNSQSKYANEQSKKVDPTNRILNAIKIGKANKGSKCAEDLKIQISEKLKGRVISNEHSKKISQSLKGKAKSDEHKQRLSEARIGIRCEHTSKRNSDMNSKKFKCEYCNREIGGLANYKRYHGNKCKQNPTLFLNI